MAAVDEWASASDLAEYVYCPRALYYRRVDGGNLDTAETARGRRYHQRALGGERRRSSRSAPYWTLLAAGAALVAISVFLLIP